MKTSRFVGLIVEADGTFGAIPVLASDQPQALAAIQASFSSGERERSLILVISEDQLKVILEHVSSLQPS